LPTATSRRSPALPDDCLRQPYPVDLPWKNGMPASALETSLDELKFKA
jgi:ectoine hydroxylase